MLSEYSFKHITLDEFVDQDRLNVQVFRHQPTQQIIFQRQHALVTSHPSIKALKDVCHQVNFGTFQAKSLQYHYKLRLHPADFAQKYTLFAHIEQNLPEDAELDYRPTLSVQDFVLTQY